MEPPDPDPTLLLSQHESLTRCAIMVVEVVVEFKKNIAAKLATVIASMTALGALWALAHTNPPSSAGTAPLAAAATSSPVTGRAATTSRAAAPTPTSIPTQKTNTRTRAS